MSNPFTKISKASSDSSKLDSINKINKTILLSSIKEDLLNYGYFDPLIKRTFDHSMVETTHFVLAMSVVSDVLHTNFTDNVQSLIPHYINTFSVSLSQDHSTLTIIYPILSSAQTTDDIISISTEMLRLCNTLYEYNNIHIQHIKSSLQQKYSIKNVEVKMDIMQVHRHYLTSIKELQDLLSSHNSITNHQTKINSLAFEPLIDHLNKYKQERLYQALNKTLYNLQNIIEIRNSYTTDLFL